MEQWKKNLYVCWISQVLSLMGFGFFIPFIPLFIQELGVHSPEEVRKWVGLLAAAPGLTLGLMAPVWGIVADRMGRKLMILRAMGAGTIIIAVSGFVHSVQALLLMRALQGMVSGTVTASATLVASGTPKERLSSTLGLLASSNFIGYSLGPLLGGISAELVGYRNTFFMGAAIVLVGFVLVLFFVKEIKPGLSADSQQAVPSRSPLRSMLSPTFLALFLVLFALRFSRTMPAAFIPLYIQELRQSVEGVSVITGAITGAVGLAAAVAGLTIARLGDRFEKRLLISIFSGIAAISALPIFFTVGIPSFVLFYVGTAYVLGGIEPNLQSYLSMNTPPENRGLLFGVQTLVGSMGWFLSPLAGSAISIQLGIKHVFLFFSGALFVSFALSMFVRRRRTSTGSPSTKLLS